jgi:hypothetical protein
MRIGSKPKDIKLVLDKKHPAMKKKSGKKNAVTQTAGAKSGKRRTEKGASDTVLTGVTLEEKHRLIAEAAYYRAERRNFVPGYELEDWLGAEAEIEGKIPKAARNRPIEIV